MVFMYVRDWIRLEECVDIDVTKLSISPKHAARYLQFAGLNFAKTIPSREHEDALDQALQSPRDRFLLNEIDFESKTSTLGHIVRGPPSDAVKRMQSLLEANACRPRFYDDEFWNQSVLTDALDAGNFMAVEEIVKYCLKSMSTGHGVDVTVLEPGYVAIVLAALPAIDRAKPLLATWIAQYVSNIQPSRFISGFDDAEFDSRSSRFTVFARVEQLSIVGHLGLFITVMIEILNSIVWLITIMTAIIFAFAHALWVLLHNPSPKIPVPASGNSFETFDNSLKSMWEFLSADFVAIDGWNAGRSMDIMRILFTFIGTIVLLNIFSENWLPAIIFYEATSDELQSYQETVKNKIPWVKP
ncbi:hypothetical protein BC938DRAFT_481510 [Jimgerdemannia flammicorona]|uniref:Ion transport domain-containing protein n=1 Tax=Jimgerdemannia flammicorona TaxID=994334 RepID=A0A433QWY6_9FUNG|nr:hypothetical protein BC938DRAFT_481510 [Jimgerdemannia flammicorona]